MSKSSTRGVKSSQSRSKATKAQPKAKGTKKKEELQDSIDLEDLRQSRREELAEKDDAEVDELYFTTFGQEPEEGLTKEEKIDHIVGELNEAPHTEPLEENEEEGEVFGNQDKDEEFAIPKSITDQSDWEEMVVVRQVPTRVVEGELVELKGQAIVQVYKPEVYQRMVKDKFFSESKLKVKVLHKP